VDVKQHEPTVDPEVVNHRVIINHYKQKEATMKGLPLQAVQQKHTVDLWISSPTGDSSDSFVFNIVCHNAEQARLTTK
jgi:hypothetical protein